MLNINEIIEDLKDDFEWQNAPRPLYPEDFEKIVRRAVRMFFKDINHPEEYDVNLFIVEDGVLYYDREFNANEIEYLLILAKLSFIGKIQSDLDGATSYSTDALTVSGVAQAWSNLRSKIDGLEHERRINFYKMTTYALG